MRWLLAGLGLVVEKRMLRGWVLLAALAAAGCTPAPAPASHAAAHQGIDQTDADFALRLGLLEGHLTVGRQLLEAGRTEDALPHFGHPIHELYGDLRPVIEARHLPQFDRDLIAAEAEAAAHGATPAFRASLQDALAKCSQARGSIAAEEFHSDAFTLRLVADVVTAASEEYREAVVAGRIGSMVEYEDARGFVLYADSVLSGHPSADPKFAAARRVVDTLKTFVGPLLPPSGPVQPVSAFDQNAETMRGLLKD